MSSKADRARLEYLLKLIDDLDLIFGRHNGVTGAIEDVEGFHAVMMCCLQLGETLNKLENTSLREQLPVSLAYATRLLPFLNQTKTFSHGYTRMDTDKSTTQKQNLHNPLGESDSFVFIRVHP